jgi:hypothetical protein
MKTKIIAISLTLAFIVAGFGFSQDAAAAPETAPAAAAPAAPAAAAPGLKFSGSVKTGLRVQTVKAGGPVSGYESGRTGFDFFSDNVDDDDGNNDGRAIRFDLNGLYDAGDWGVKFGFRTQLEKSSGVASGGMGSPAGSVREAFAFANFLNKVVNVKAGVIDSVVWNTGGLKNRDLDRGLGVRVELTPIKGLNAGLFFGDGTQSYGVTGGAATAENFFQFITFGAIYKTDAFYAAAAYKPRGKPKGDGGNNKSITDNVGLDNGTVRNQFILGFGVTAVENLEVNVEALFVDGFDEERNPAKYSNYRNNINLDVNYTIGSITPGLEFYYYMPRTINYITNEMTSSPYSSSSLNFPVDSTEIRIYPKAFYEVNDNLTVGGAIKLKFRTADIDDKSKIQDGYKEWKGVSLGDLEFSIQPSLEYKIGNATIVLFDEVFFVTYNNGLSNTVQLDFIYSF